jgi:uncharacterized protein involved in exopolysaccharide biosynthesis
VDQEISVFDIVSELRSRPVFYSSIVAALLLVTAIAIAVMPRTYRATITLMPVEAGGVASGLAALAGQFGGLASLAGVPLSGLGGGDQAAVATLRSRDLIYTFVEREQLLPVLFSRKWDDEKQHWTVPEPREVPTLWDAYKLFDKKIRRVDEDKRNGVVTLSVHWRDPVLAARWANELVRLTNEQTRQRSIAESESRIGLLRKELELRQEVELQQGIFRLIQAEINRITIARAAEDFAFQVIDPAVAPDHDAYVRPRPFLYLVLAALLGVFTALVTATVRLINK